MTKAEERRAYLQAQSATQPQINIQPTQTMTRADQRRLELQQAQQPAAQPVVQQPTPQVTQPVQPTPVVTQPQVVQAPVQQAAPVVQQTTSMADKLRSGARLTPEETIQAAVEMGKISPEEGQKRLNVVSKAPLDQAIIQTQTEIKDDIAENNLLGKVNSKKYFEYQNKLEKAKEDGNIVKETAYQNLLDKMDETYKPMTKDWYNIKKPNTDQLKSSLENSISSVKWMEKKLLDSQTADEQNKNIKLYEQAYDYYNKALKEYQDALLYERYNRNPILAELDILGYTGANSMANIIEGTGRDIKNSHESLYGYGYDNINAEELIKQNEISKTAQDEKSRIMQGINPSINALRQQANKKDANDEIKNLYQQIMTGTFNGTAKDIQTILDNAKDRSSTFQARENVERKLQHKKEKFDWEYEPSDITKELLGGLEQVAAMIPTQAATMINPTLGDVAIYQRTGNPAYNKARAEGATSSQAEANKTLKGSLEAALEHFMTSSIDKAVGRTGLIAPSEWAEHIANPWLRTGTAAAVDMVSEGVEEIPSAVLDPIIDRITYNPDAPLATAEDIWGAFTESMLPTAIMLGVGGTIQAVETYANNATNKVNNSPLSELKKAELINQIENGKKELLKQINARANEINQNSLNETTNNQIAKDAGALNLQPTQNMQTTSQNVLNNNNISLAAKVTELNKQGYNIPKSTADILQTIQNQRGVTINFDANVKGNGAYNEATRTITLNPNSNRAIEFTTVHELAHDLKAGNMEDYTSLQNTVLDYARKNPNFLNAIESLDQTYKNEIGKGNYNINDEATNDILAEAIGNQEFLNSLAQEKPNLFQRIYNWFKNVLFDGNKSGLTLEQRRTLNKMEQGFRNAYQKAFNGVQQEGIQSVNNVKNSLSEAEETAPTQDNQGRQLSEGQQSYFRDSKIKDVDGKLLAMYHGTNGDFYTFDLGKIGNNTKNAGNFGDGFYFTYSKDRAKDYGKNVKETYLNIKNPFSYDSLYYLPNGTESYSDYTVITNLVNMNNEWGKIPIKFASKYTWQDIADTVNEMSNENASDSQIDNALYEKYGDIAEQGLADRIYTYAKQEGYKTLRETLAEKGYDGIIDGKNAQDSSQIVAFNSNQIKNVDNTTPTSNPDIRYSLSEAETDDRTLAATHNLTRDKLKGILELGGFPVPSIAISDVNKLTPTQFGDITVLFDKDTINPENPANEVYDRDVWSPTFPQVDYDINNADIKKYITNGLDIDYKDDIASKAVTNYLYAENLGDKLMRRGKETLLQEIKNAPEMKYLYKTAVEKADYTPLTKSKQYSWDYPNSTLQRFIDTFNQNHDMSLSDFFYHYINYGDMQMTKEQQDEINKEIQETIRPDLIKKYEDVLSKSELEKNKGFIEENIQKRLDNVINVYGKYYDFLKDAAELDANGEGTTTDVDATLNDIIKHTDTEKYEKWVDDTFGKMFDKAKKGIRNDKDTFTASGNRRSFDKLHTEYTLNNIVNIMTKGKTQGGEDTFLAGGYGKTAAQLAKQFNNIEDIRSSKSKLTSTQEAAQATEELKNKSFEDFTELAQIESYKSASHFSYDNAMEAIEYFAGKYKNNLSLANFKKVLKKFGIEYGKQYTVDGITYKTDDNLLNRIIGDLEAMKDIPTDYFEAKPQRAVGLDEVASVLIPNDLPEEQKQALADRGIRYIEYNPEVEGDREAKYREAAQDVLFSKSNNTWQQFLDNTYGKWNTGTRTNFESLPSNEELQQQETKSIENEPIVQMSENKKTKKLEDIANSSIEDVKQRPMEYTQRKDKNTSNQRKFFDNVETSNIIADETKSRINPTTYEVKHNLDTLETMRQRLDERGNDLIEDWKHKSKNFNDNDVALGAILLERYQQQGDWNSAARTAEKLADMSTETARALQMYSIWQRLSPETMQIFTQKQLNEAFEEMKQRKTGKWVEANKDKFKLTAEESQFIYDQVEKASQAIDDETKQRELSKIENMINNKLPPEKGQTIKALRRIAMLCNPKTQVRNFAGNGLIIPVNDVADLVGTVIDKAVAKKTGVRTTSVPNIATKAKGFAKGVGQAIKDYKTGTRTTASGNKYEFDIGAKPFNENTGSKIKNAIARGLNATNDLLSAVMSGGDRPFYEAAYQNSLEGQMKANNVTKPTQEMIDIAVNEALQRTWNDDNNYTKTVLSIRKAMNNINIKGFGLGDLIIPFAKTPANLTKAMVEYSPAGFIESVIDFNDMRKAISRGEMTPMQQKKFVNSTSKAIAGSLLYLIAGTLVKAGKITGSADDDKDVKNFEQNVLGIQPYSVRIGDKTYTYSWANPINAPLAIMADTYKMSKEDASKWDILTNAFKVAGETLVDNSFLQGIKELFGKDSISEGIVDAIESFPESMIPTFFSQIASLNDKTQRQTFEYQNDFQTIANKIKNKLPGARNTLAPQVNTFGEEIENQNNAFNAFLSPANVREARITDEQKALYDVYQETKDKTIFPMQAPYYTNTDNGEKQNLTTQDRATYQKASGQYVNDAYEGLFNDEVFKDLKNEGKVKILHEIATDGNLKGRESVGAVKEETNSNLDKLNERNKELEKANIPLADYYIAWYAKNNLAQGKTNDSKKKAIRDYTDLTADQEEVLYGIFNIQGKKGG